MTSYDLLTRLCGRWVGPGNGKFPTIDPFEYDERWTLAAAPDYPMLRHEQRTWLRPDRKASHWELGFWRFLDDGRVELSTAQDSGRVEVLRGQPEPVGPDGLRIELASTVLGNDDRLVRTERVITLAGDELHYVKRMTTTTTPAPRHLQHLEARLRRDAAPA